MYTNRELVKIKSCNQLIEAPVDEIVTRLCESHIECIGKLEAAEASAKQVCLRTCIHHTDEERNRSVAGCPVCASVELARLRDAVEKGDLARQMAGGMEMEIQDLRARVAELEDAAANDVTNQTPTDQPKPSGIAQDVDGNVPASSQSPSPNVQPTPPAGSARLGFPMSQPVADSVRLDFVLSVIHNHGSRGLGEVMYWTLNDPLDREEIDKAIARSKHPLGAWYDKKDKAGRSTGD